MEALTEMDAEAYVDFYQKLKEELETTYKVVVLDEAIVCAEDLIHQVSFCLPFPGETSEEKLRLLLTEVCNYTVSKIHDNADVKELDHIYHNLCLFLVEQAELVKEKDYCSKDWLGRLSQELDTAEKDLLPFFQRSLDPSSGVFELIQNLVTTCRDVLFPVLETVDWVVISNYLNQFLSLFLPVSELIRQRFLHILSVDHSRVEEFVSRSTGIPIPQLPFFGKLVPQFPTNLVNKFPEVERKLNGMVVGQNHVVKGIINNLKTLNKEEDWQRRYRRAFLFLGPSGVGKTQLAEAIALHFYGDKDRLIQIDMSVLTKFDLLELSSHNPYSVMLFEKIEESDPVVLENIAEILARGCGFGFCKTIIMTSGVGSEHFRLPMSNRDQLVVDEARRVFKPDLMNLMDSVYVFNTMPSKFSVARLLIRDWAGPDIRILVYPSVDISTLLMANNLHNGHEIKKWLAENIFPKMLAYVGNHVGSSELPFLSGMDRRTDETCVVYVDTLVGSSELSFRLGSSPGDLAEDWYFKRTGKSLRKLSAIYTTEREVTRLTLKLEGICSALKEKLNGGMISVTEVDEVAVLIKSLGELLLPYEHSLDSMCYCYKEEEMLPFRELTIKFDDRQKEAVKERVTFLKKKLQAHIKGQNLHIDVIADCVLRSLNAPADPPSRPSGIYLFLGLEGAEKDKLGDDIFELVGVIDGAKPLVQVDLSDSSSAHSLLCSDAPNWSGNEYDLSAVEAVRRWPYSVVVFDKIEKVDACAYNSLLQVLDTGILHCLDGVTVDFRNATIILISDFASKKLIARSFGSSEKTTQKGVSRFRSELLNRVDDVIFSLSTSQVPNKFISLSKKMGIAAEIDGISNRARCIFRNFDMSDEQFQEYRQTAVRYVHACRNMRQKGKMTAKSGDASLLYTS